MATIGTTQRPAYVYDLETDTWIPIGVGPHTHSDNLSTTVINAKGDILIGTGPTALGVLPIGTNGQVLKVNTSATNKLEWATDATGITTGKAIAMAIVFGG